jgi:electron transfer flavoprotein alpha subunit
MKTENDGYDDCLILWESIWTASVIRRIGNTCEEDISKDNINIKVEKSEENTVTENSDNTVSNTEHNINKQLIEIPEVQFRDGSHSRSNSLRNKEIRDSKNNTKKESSNLNPKSSEKKLTDAELYSLSICLSIIRRERDLIMSQTLDATEILKVFS